MVSADFVDRMMGSRFQGVSPDTFFKFTNLDSSLQVYLQRVYLTLALALAVSALGCYADIVYHFAGILTYVAAFGCMVGLGMTSSAPHTLNKRYAMLAGFAFSQGASMGRLVNIAIALQPGLVLTAFMATAAVFACFSAAALLSPRRAYLYLGGWLASAISAFMVLRLGTWMFGGQAIAFQAELYLGLLVFSGYILFDTQMIVEKAAATPPLQRDHVKSALELLVDVLAIFVRVLIILTRNAARKEEEERRRKARR